MLPRPHRFVCGLLLVAAIVGGAFAGRCFTAYDHFDRNGRFDTVGHFVHAKFRSIDRKFSLQCHCVIGDFRLAIKCHFTGGAVYCQLAAYGDQSLLIGC